jgi:hypothetical protein
LICGRFLPRWFTSRDSPERQVSSIGQESHRFFGFAWPTLTWLEHCIICVDGVQASAKWAKKLKNFAQLWKMA